MSYTVKSKNEINKEFSEFIDSLLETEIPTVLSNGFLTTDLSTEPGKFAESLFESWLVSNNIKYEPHPNGAKNFPDFVVHATEGKLPYELKELSVTNKRLLKVSEAFRAIAADIFFETTVITLYKRNSSPGAVTISKVEIVPIFTLLKSGGTYGIGYDSTNSNITRSGTEDFSSHRDVVEILLSLIPHIKSKNKQVPLIAIESVKTKYGLV